MTDDAESDTPLIGHNLPENRVHAATSVGRKYIWVPPGDPDYPYARQAAIEAMRGTRSATGRLGDWLQKFLDPDTYKIDLRSKEEGGGRG